MNNIFTEVRPVSKTALNILQKRYFDKNEDSWDKLAERNVNYIYDEYISEDYLLTKEMILNRYFVPNSPSLVNAGKPNSGLCACFVVDFPDTIEGIFKTKLDFALIARKGGGCGTTLTKIRPEGSFVHGSTHGYAGGPIKFADTISHDADAMTQAGFRSMAIMLTMSVYHPDILKFITAKKEEGKIANANMSVVVDDNFMKAVENNETFWTEFNGTKYQEYNAREIFSLIINGSWENGEPGLLFSDRILNSPYQYTGQEILATNPCSEQPLPPNGVCNLGSFDLSKFIKDKDFDFDKFEIAVELGTKYLDKVVDKSSYPTPEIQEWAKDNRAIGLGIMGFADYCLIKEIAYGSPESINELDKILKFMQEVAEKTSIELGIKKGIPKYCQFLPVPRRNITLTTIAPTGTISIIAGCSSGIEPIFSEITIRNDKTGTYTFENNLASKPYFRCAVASNGATEVTWEEHVNILATAQRHIDSGVSKTINFPSHTKRETMEKAAMLAWQSGCKGLAMYRNGSRKTEVLSPKNLKKDKCPVCGCDVATINKITKCLKCSWRSDDSLGHTSEENINAD